MAKHKPKPSAATAGSGRPWQCWASVVVVMAAVVALGLAALQPSDPVPSPASPPASARQDGRRSAATVDLGPGELAGFSAEHNASLMWGTYRPGVYFGLRSRTYPTALVAGLMWGALDGVASERKLRHTCEQDEVQRYGYTEHDGEAYASQPIVDRENGLELQTSFVKPDAPEAAGAWAARIEGKLLPGQSKGAPQTVIFYLGIDGDGGGASRLSVAAERPTFTPGAGTHVTGEVDGVGRFSLLAEGRSNAGGARSDDDAEVCEAERGPSLQPRCWGGAGAQATYLHVREIAGRELLDSAELRLSDEVSEDSQLLLVQFVATPPFTLDFVYVPGSARLTHPPPPPPTPRPLTHITSARRARSPYRARRAHRPCSPYRLRRLWLPAAPIPELRRCTVPRWVRGRGVQGGVQRTLRPAAEHLARAPPRRLRGRRGARLCARHRAAGRRAALRRDEALRGRDTGRAARVARLLLRHDLSRRAGWPRDRPHEPRAAALRRPFPPLLPARLPVGRRLSPAARRRVAARHRQRRARALDAPHAQRRLDPARADPRGRGAGARASRVHAAAPAARQPAHAHAAAGAAAQRRRGARGRGGVAAAREAAVAAPHALVRLAGAHAGGRAATHLPLARARCGRQPAQRSHALLGPRRLPARD
eukprot:scaffold39935_cov57-Phaeocystis_antarctica.AAC.1